MKFKRGSVVYVMHTKNQISQAIAWFMRDPRAPKIRDMSHSAIICDAYENEAWLCETTDTQVAYGRLSSYLNDPNCHVEVFEPMGVTEFDIDACIREVEDNRGKLYAYYQLFSWATVCALAKIKIQVPNWLPFGFVCNSHVLDGLRKLPIAPFHGIEPQSIHTMRMYAMMLESPNWKRVLVKEAE